MSKKYKTKDLVRTKTVRTGGATRTLQGFTLLELLIAMAVFAILCAISYPSYVQYAKKARRAEARSVLMTSQGILERCYAKSFAYDSSQCAALPTASENGYYAISSQVSGNTYVIKATAQGVQLSDKQCASYSVSNIGERLAQDSSSRDSTSACW